MLLKWIECAVPEASREAFDHAQRLWRRIRYTEGLVLQIGGYDVEATQGACVLGVWRDEGSYRRFLSLAHDAVTSQNHQDEHHEGMEIALYDVVSRMPGQRPRLADAFASGRLLRATACDVKPDRTHSFMRAQLDVWTPGMAAAKGMFGGLFARKQGSEASFVEITAWESEELHQLYADHHHPALEQRAGAADDVESAATRRIALERNWTVLSVS